jgi:hypothetical protein
MPTFPIASAVTAFRSRWFGANTPGLLYGGRANYGPRAAARAAARPPLV